MLIILHSMHTPNGLILDFLDIAKPPSLNEKYCVSPSGHKNYCQLGQVNVLAIRNLNLNIVRHIIAQFKAIT